MPEIPDLNIYRDNLLKELKGKVVEGIEIFKATKVKPPDGKLIEKALSGHKLNNILRDGKQLYFQFDGKEVFGFHLMLHGKFFIADAEGNDEVKGKIMSMSFSDGKILYLTDRFGWARGFLNTKMPKVPDVMSKKFTFDYFDQQLDKKESMKIKEFLTDQKIMRGLGNAYTDEILAEAQINPYSIAGKIPEAARKMLFKSIPKVLKRSEKYIRKVAPDTINDIIRDHLKVHNAKKEKSQKRPKIKSVKSGGSKTYFTDLQKLYD